MSTVRLYCPDLAQGEVTLSPEESRHAAASRRVVVGQTLTLFDGAGGEAEATVTKADRGGLLVEVGEVVRYPHDSKIELTLAIAMGKTHRQSYVVEKCTELGVAAIWPMHTERSVAKPGAPVVRKWSRRAVEAAKQSRRRWLPKIEPPRSLAEIVDAFSSFAAVALADTSVEPTGFDVLLQRADAAAPVLVLVGPEGGWSESERTQLCSAGAVVVSLGPTILRTETAAVAACAAAAMRSLALRDG